MVNAKVFLPLVVMLAGVTLSAQNPGADHASDVSCTVTGFQNPQFLPPSTYLQRAPSGTFWYGTDSLWTLLGSNGTWHGRGASDCNGYCTKLTYWSAHFDWRSESQPKLTVTAHRLHQEAPLIVASAASAVFVNGPMPAAMMVTIDIPAPGCWEITAKYRDQKLSFVRSIRLER